MAVAVFSRDMKEYGKVKKYISSNIAEGRMKIDNDGTFRFQLDVFRRGIQMQKHEYFARKFLSRRFSDKVSLITLTASRLF